MNAWYDSQKEPKRFLIFLAFVGIPLASLMATDHPAFFCAYAILAYLFRRSRI